MKQLVVYQCLGVLLIMGMALPSVIGTMCSCQLLHPQKQFCNADLVIVGTVQAKQLVQGSRHPAFLPGRPATLTYKIAVSSIKKGRNLAQQLIGSDRELVVNTTASNVSCGVPWLEVGRQYVLTVMVLDRKPSLHFCHFQQAYSRLTNMQRRGINGAYARGCEPHCQIYTCRSSGDCSATTDTATTCVHGNSRTHKDCYYQHGYCRAKSPGVCAWKTNEEFEPCLQMANQIV